MTKPVEFEASCPCECPQAEARFGEPRVGFWPRLGLWRDRQLARRALQCAGEPGLVLDLPCADGGFWPLLAEKANRVIIAADHSALRLEAALARQPAELRRRIRPLQTSPLDIELSDSAVDSIFCMSLLSRVGEAPARHALLREFHRVTRDSVVLSLWVDGNFSAWQRRRLEQRCLAAGEARACRQHWVMPRGQIEREFAEVGFRIDAHYDCLPGYAMARFYVLRKG